MTYFIKKTGIFFLIVLAIHLLTGAFFSNGKTDHYYLRFTSTKQSSLIIGTSRAAQALQPKYFNKILSQTSFELPLYNFAFSLAHSPFGPTYLNAIRKKLAPETTNGLFIVAVDPWAISLNRENLNDAPLLWSEKNLCLGNTSLINFPVNYEYLIKNYNDGWGRLIIDSFKDKQAVLRKDGWLEVNVDMAPEKVLHRTKEKIAYYKHNEFYNNRTFSRHRYQYLCKTIAFLKAHGSVFLIRLPVSPQLQAIDDQLMPDFDQRMENLSSKYQVSYLNFSKDNADYQTTDGNHLFKTSGALVSQKTSRRIKKIVDSKS